MSVTNPYFTNGTTNEQNLVEDLIIESLRIHGKEFYYIPRTLVAKDEILGEDRLSRFTKYYPIEMYIENVDAFDGAGAFIQRWGATIESTATLMVARKRWEELVGVNNDTIIPDRPNEGDLIYFPMTDGLFEIKFVEHQNPFYQLGRLYTYKLQVELFNYSSEEFDTGNEDIDAFESLGSFSTSLLDNPGILTDITIINGGEGYTSAPSIEIQGDATAEAILENGVITGISITNSGTPYDYIPAIVVTGGGATTQAELEAVITNDPTDKGSKTNTQFDEEAEDVIFDEYNPFGNY